MPSDTTAPQRLGNYEIVSKIADGGMGTVYRARHVHTGEIVAVKVIAASTVKNPVLLQRFEREFMAARVLDHPNVVKAIEYCGAMPSPFLVMEYVDGESLGQRMERVGAYPEAEAVRIIGQVCEGLQRAHKQGLVHRDVKPDNILVNREGVAKLTDMGLVKDADDQLNLTKTGRGLGTPHYMAPEQFRNAKSVDVRCDIYSLGATLYAMVTGTIPFENASPLDCWMKKIRNEFPPPRELNPALSERVDWAIRRAMSAEPDRRPSSCREFLEDLTGQSRMTPNQTGRPQPAGGAADVWYMVYKDETGSAHTVKGTTEGIRKALRDNLLGDPSAILVSRTKAGQFHSLGSVPEFRDLVLGPAPLLPGAQRGSGVVGRPSGAIRQPAARPASDEADLGTTPAGGAGGSGNPPRRAEAPARPTPTNTGPTKRTPPPTAMPTPLPVASPLPVDPRAETEAYTPPDTAPDSANHTEAGDSQEAPAVRKPAKKPRKPEPFDWTPILILAVMIFSAVIGYLVLSK
jgi:serine/threonine protein kinase